MVSCPAVLGRLTGEKRRGGDGRNWLLMRSRPREQAGEEGENTTRAQRLDAGGSSSWAMGQRSGELKREGVQSTGM